MILVRKPSAVQPTWNPAARPTGSTETAWTNGSAGTPPSGSLTSRAVWRPPTWVVFISVSPRQAVPPGGTTTVQSAPGTGSPGRSGLEPMGQHPVPVPVRPGWAVNVAAAKVSLTTDTEECAA